MRFDKLNVGDYFIAMPRPEDIDASFNVFRKISDIILEGPITSRIHESGTARDVERGLLHTMPQSMPVLKVVL